MTAASTEQASHAQQPNPAIIAKEASEKQPELSVVGRWVESQGSMWRVRYECVYTGGKTIIIEPKDVSASISATVSNSRATGHHIPQKIETHCGVREPSKSIVIPHPSGNDPLQCHETITLGLTMPNSEMPWGVHWPQTSAQPSTPPLEFQELPLKPGDHFVIILTGAHEHFLQPTEPLLGARNVTITVGNMVIRDALKELNEEARRIYPDTELKIPSEVFRDHNRINKLPHQLHLAADIPEKRQYRYNEIPVLPDTEVKIKFRYVLAAGSLEGCRVRVEQYTDGPGNSPWKVLPGRREQTLSVATGWKPVEITCRTDPRATTLSLSFGFSSVDPNTPFIGEVWIDQVAITHTGAPPQTP